jgi:hypothetical protein
MSLSARLLSLALLVLAACSSSSGGDDTPDAGPQGLPPDLCNTREEGLTLPDCQLTLGQEVERYISTAGDQDWYSVQLPATAGARTLVRVTAGYRAPSTAVNLDVSLLRESPNGGSLGHVVDNHGQGAPRPVELLLPFGEPNAKLLLLVGDAPLVPSRPGFDARNTYFLKVEVVENPDTHEPNDTPAQATPVVLAARNGISQGSTTGYIATTGDVDTFSFDVAAGKILYVNLRGPTLSPPPAYRLAYTLRRPNGTAASEGNMRPQVVPANLGTARRVDAAGRWTVVVQGYQATVGEPPPGDLRQEYTLDVRVMDEQDPQDRVALNDEHEAAFARDLGATPGPATATTFDGRLGSVPDRDWYAVTVGATQQPTVLRYRLEPLGTGSRFEPLPGLPDRQIRVLTRVGVGATEAEQQQSCYTRVEACPKGYAENPGAQSLVNDFCTSRTTPKRPPLCLYSAREEVPQGFSGLSNFQGAIPVPPHGGTLTYYFLVQDDGNDWADDRDYRLSVSWLADADEQARFAGGPVELPTPATLEKDETRADFPAPPLNDPKYEVGGELTYGFGRLRPEERLAGRGVRGPEDYDAVPSDVDTFEFQLPSGLTEPIDQTWEVQWVINHLSDGGVPHNLALDLTFCDADRPDAGTSCTPVSAGNRGPLTLAYRADPLRAWHSQGSTVSGLQPLYGLRRDATSTTVTVQPYACSCLEPRFLRGGTLKVAVSATERTDYEPVRYTLRTAYTDYPQRYGTDGGSTVECPRPVLDGGVPDGDGGTIAQYAPGCFYTRQP